MSSQPKTYFTPEEYLEMERTSETKSEYFNGEIFAMGGASLHHVLIATNVSSELRFQLKKYPCTVYSADLRVKVGSSSLYTYPDVVVVCGEPKHSDDQKDTITNPILIVEVLSKSTQGYDRGEKFELYRTISSFREYVMVAQDKPHVEHNVRQADNSWVLSETNRIEDQIELISVNCILKLSEIYDKVSFPEFV